jgi:hypothetical protein
MNLHVLVALRLHTALELIISSLMTLQRISSPSISCYHMESSIPGKSAKDEQDVRRRDNGCEASTNGRIGQAMAISLALQAHSTLLCSLNLVQVPHQDRLPHLNIEEEVNSNDRNISTIMKSAKGVYARSSACDAQTFVANLHCVGIAKESYSDNTPDAVAYQDDTAM